MRRTFRGFLLLLLSMPLHAGAAPVVLVLGDSLSAAHGIPLEQGWVELLRERIRSRDLPHEVINASVSGETSRGGLERLPELLARHEPEVVLIELGGNDGLRGQSPARLAENLGTMVQLAQEADARPVLFEMRIPANYGATYSERFRAAFSDVAQARDVPLVPFLLGDIADDEDAFQADGIHPNAEAQPVILDAVWPHLLPVLRASKSAQSRK